MADTADQYRIITEGAGWLRRPDRGRLRVEGRDAIAFLQGLLTNDVRALSEGDGIYAAYLTPQGRMITDLRAYHCGGYVLAQVPGALAASLAERFDQSIFTEDVRVTDVSSTIAQLTIVGAAAAELAGRACGDAPRDASSLASLKPLGHVHAGYVRIARSDEVDEPAFDIFLDQERVDAMIETLQSFGVRPCAGALFDALRISAGRPAFGVDMNDETIPLEAGLLERAISTSKGCYVGQEIIIRVLHRGGGRVAKRLVKLRFDRGVAVPAAGMPLFDAAREVGRITSAAEAPQGGAVVALAYVQRERAEAGGSVSLSAEAGGHAGSIVGLAG
jgi:folate-binding protein YgfZ